MSNTSLHRAKSARRDEFYTLKHDIINEVSRYRKGLEGKVVYSNCDGPESNFTRYLSGLPMGIREFHHSSEPFQSPASLVKMEQADVIITNPPFSQMGEFLTEVIRRQKDFLIVAPLTACQRKVVFDLIKEDKVRLGFGFKGGRASFKVPETSEYRTDKRFDPTTGQITFGNIVWLTNMEYDIWPTESDKKVRPTAKYHPDKYPTYENYRAINVDKVADIPADFDGYMGVPISYLDKHDPKLFTIHGLTTATGVSSSFRVWDKPRGAPIVNGVAKYVRIIIGPNRDEERKAGQKD